MELSKILAPQAVKVVASTSSKKRLLHDLSDLAFVAYGLPAAETVEALMERETLGPTGVGNGVALPSVARRPNTSVRSHANFRSCRMPVCRSCGA